MRLLVPAVLALGITVLPGRSWAQDQSIADAIAVDGQGCLTSASVAVGVAAFLGRDRIPADLAVEVKRADNQVTLRFTGRSAGTRALTIKPNERCENVQRAAAIVIAIHIDPSVITEETARIISELELGHPPTPGPSVDNPPGTDPPGTDPPGTDPPGTDPPGTDPPGTDPPGTDPPGTDPPGTDPPGTDPPGTPPAATTLPATAPPASDAPIANLSSTGADGSGGTPPFTSPHLALSMQAGVGLGLVPGPAAVFQPAIEMRLLAPLDLRVAGTFTTKASTDVAPGQVEAQLFGGRVDLCGTLETGGFRFRGCAEGLGGAMLGTSTGFSQTFSTTSAWLALGAGVGAVWNMSHRFGLVGGVDLLFPLLKPAFQIVDPTGAALVSHQLPPVAGMATLGPFVTFW